MYSNLSLRCVACVYRVQYLSLRCVDQEEVTSRVRNLSEFVSEEAMPAPDYFRFLETLWGIECPSNISTIGPILDGLCDKRHIIVRWYRNPKHEKHLSFMGLNALASIG